MTKKEVEIKEEELKNNFKAFPRLADYFINVEYFIRNFGRYRWKEGTTREKLRLEADTLTRLTWVGFYSDKSLTKTRILW